MLRTPSLTVDKTDHDTYLQTRLRSLSAGFDVDVSGAAGLTGQALDQWLDAAEDRLFEAGLADLLAMKAERERGYQPPGRPPAAPAAPAA